MNTEQTIQAILTDIATIKARQKTDNDRIEENKALIRPLTTQLERLATNFEHLATQVKGSNERIDKIVENAEVRQKGLGERTGRIEVAVEKQSVISEKLLQRMTAAEADIDEIKTKGSKRWEGLIEKIICVVVGAAIMAILYRFGVS